MLADSIPVVKQALENVDSNKEWLFSGIGVYILGGFVTILGFVIVFLWRKALRKEFSPTVIIGENGASSITIGKAVAPHTDIQQLVEAEKKKHPTYDVTPIDPFHNIMGAAFQQSNKFTNQKTYMTQLNLYLKSYRKYAENIEKQRQGDSMMYPIKLQLCNKGRSAGNDIKIVITVLSGKLYLDANKREQTSFRLKPPVDFGQCDILFIPPSLQSEPYTFHTWDLSTPVATPQTYECRIARPRSTETDILPTFYIDRSAANDVDVKWEIYASNLVQPCVGTLHLVVKKEC